MKLQDSYFTIKKISYPNSDNHHGKIKIDLISSHPVYNGHFPGEPVCPGVCSLQMIKECAQLMAHEKFIFSYIKQYRLLEVLTPFKHPHLMAEIFLSSEERPGSGIVYSIKASLSNMGADHTKFLELQGELSIIK